MFRYLHILSNKKEEILPLFFPLGFFLITPNNDLGTLFSKKEYRSSPDSST